MPQVPVASEMSDALWREFFIHCSRVLGQGDAQAARSQSWCSWTTFARLRADAKYWAAGLPAERELLANGTGDGGTWSQPFIYQEIAHVIVPRRFTWELILDRSFESGAREQAIDRLSEELTVCGIKHRTTSLVLEIKLF